MVRTDFQHAVYRVVRRIPSGHVTSYGRVASLAGHPAAARGVGAALRALSEERSRPSAAAGEDAHASVAGEPSVTGDGSAGEAPMAADVGVPWWRIVSWEGTISTSGIDRTAHIQRALLEGEGVTFDAQGRISWARHGWKMDEPVF